MDLMRLDPNKLRHFISVLDEGSFARAAALCGITQPAMSKSIRALEAVLEMRLFERGRAGARPTDRAEVLASHARVILGEYALAEAELRALSQAKNQDIIVGASISLCKSLLPDVVVKVRRRWPAMRIAVEVGLSTPLYASLLSGDLDLVLSAPEAGVAVDARLVRTLLHNELDVVVVGAGHPLLQRHPLGLEDLSEFPWIVPRQSSRLAQIHAVFATAKVPPPCEIIRTESIDLAVSLLKEESFICLLGEGLLRPELRAGEIVALPDLGFANERPAYAAHRRGARPGGPICNVLMVVQEVVSHAQSGHMRL